MANQSTDRGKLLSISVVQWHWRFWRSFPLKFLWEVDRRGREKQIVPPSHHFHGFPWTVLVSNIALDQLSVCEKLLSYGKIWPSIHTVRQQKTTTAFENVRKLRLLQTKVYHWNVVVRFSRHRLHISCLHIHVHLKIFSKWKSIFSFAILDSYFR